MLVCKQCLAAIEAHEGKQKTESYYDDEVLCEWCGEAPVERAIIDGNINVLIIKPRFAPYAQRIESGYKSLQSVVGGFIEAIYPFDDDVALICNADGKINGLPTNRTLVYPDGSVADTIRGTFLIARVIGDRFGSLTEEQIEKYYALFEQTEQTEVA